MAKERIRVTEWQLRKLKKELETVKRDRDLYRQAVIQEYHHQNSAKKGEHWPPEAVKNRMTMAMAKAEAVPSYLLEA